MSIKDGTQPLVSFKKRWTHLKDPTSHKKLAANIVAQQGNRGGGGEGDIEASHKWTNYSHTLQQMTILVVVCSYLYIVTFLAVYIFLDLNIMNFKRKSFKFFVKGCREER